jgi:Arc/MetJ-type ribon-helix-helix transcriptional regulator
MKARINEVVHNGLFSNMTEFIREAIRKSIDEYETKKAIRGLEMLRGKARLLTKAEQKRAKAELKHMSASELFRKYGLD